MRTCDATDLTKLRGMFEAALQKLNATGKVGSSAAVPATSVIDRRNEEIAEYSNDEGANDDSSQRLPAVHANAA